MSQPPQRAGSFERALVAIVSVFVGMLLLVCPGLFMMFLFPSWAGLPLAAVLAAYGAFRAARFGDDVLGTGSTR